MQVEEVFETLKNYMDPKHPDTMLTRTLSNEIDNIMESSLKALGKKSVGSATLLPTPHSKGPLQSAVRGAKRHLLRIERLPL